MATFKSQNTTQTVSANTETAVYTGAGTGVPNATGAVLIGLHAANIGNVTAKVDIYFRDNASSAATDNVYIIRNADVPAGSTLNALPSKIVLNYQDKIYMQATVANTIQVTASVLEN